MQNRSSDSTIDTKKNDASKTRFHSYPVDHSGPHKEKEYRSGQLLKLKGKHPFRSWEMKMCNITSYTFRYHGIKNNKSNTLNLGAYTPFILTPNDAKSKKLMKYSSKTPIQWKESHILCFKPLRDNKKIRYFVVPKKELDLWLEAINLAKVDGEIGDKDEVQFILNMDYDSKNEVHFKEVKETDPEDSAMVNQDPVKEENNVNEMTKDDNSSDKGDNTQNLLQSTKEMPFSEFSDDTGSENTAQPNRKYAYSLRTLRKMDISEFTFDDVENSEKDLPNQE